MLIPLEPAPNLIRGLGRKVAENQNMDFSDGAYCRLITNTERRLS